MFYIQWHIELVAEAADRVKSGDMPVEQALDVIREQGFSFDNLDFTIQQVTILSELSTDLKKLLEAHTTTTDILSRWTDKEITSEQVNAELESVRSDAEIAMKSAESALGQMVGEDGTALTNSRLGQLPDRIKQSFEPQEVKPTEVIEGCAGESSQGSIVSRRGQVAFVSNRDGNAEIYAMNADGSGVTRLTDNPAGDYSPAWSPDGKRIIFHSHRYLGAGRIFVMNADGSGVTRLTDPAWDDWSPDWSPDGKQIVFNSSRFDNRDIWLMNADGSGMTNLTRHPADDWWPAWSPDGKQIVFHSDRDGNFDIYLMAITDKVVTRLTDDPSLEYDADWSPDGTRIAYTSDRSGNQEICIKNVSGMGVVNLTRHPANDWAAAWRPAP